MDTSKNNIPFSVSLKQSKDFKKITGSDFKEIIVNIPDGQDGQEYKGEFTYHFSTFEDAKEFYLINAERLNLVDFTYSNYRWTQHLNNNAPEWSKEAYYELIKSDVI